MPHSFEPANYWETRASPRGERPALDATCDASIVVVGGGILGCSTALHMAEAGHDIALVEAHDIGCGASGRNTGFVVPSLRSSIGPDDVAGALGPDRAERLLRLVSSAGDAVFDLIRRFDITCDAEQTGWIQAAHCQAASDMLLAHLPHLERMGVAIEFRDQAAMQQMTGLPWVRGGLVLPTGGQLDPLAYVRNVADAAQRAGARLFVHSAAQSITRDGDGWRVETERGRIRAGCVLLTTNALVGHLAPALARSIVPMTVYQVVSEPLPAEVRQRILPAGAPMTDTRRHTFALRWSPDGRLMTGGLVSPGPDRRGAAVRWFSRRLRQNVPDMAALRPAYVWSGRIAVTLDALPRMIELGPNLYGAIACNGRGIALATALGRELAAWLIKGKAGNDDFVLQITPPRQIPFANMSALGAHLALPWMNIRDAGDMARDA